MKHHGNEVGYEHCTEYFILYHAIENTANQKARNPLHILRMQRIVFHENPGVPRVLQIFIYLYFFYQNYVLSRNVANLLNIISLIVFAVKALKSDVLRSTSGMG